MKKMSNTCSWFLSTPFHTLCQSTRISCLSSIVLLVLAIHGTTASFASQLVQFTLLPMTGTEIRNELIGTQLSGEYSSGRGWSEQLKSNLTSIYEEDGSKLKGRVSVTANQICFTYSREGDGRMGSQSITGVGGCFEVWKRSANCFDFYSATSPPPLRIRRFARNWLARAWKTSSESTCENIPVSWFGFEMLTATFAQEKS